MRLEGGRRRGDKVSMEISEAESKKFRSFLHTQYTSHSKPAKLNVYYMKFSVEAWNKLQNPFLSVMQTSRFQQGLCSGHVKSNVCSVLSA